MIDEPSLATSPSPSLFDIKAKWTPEEISLGNLYLTKVKAREYFWPTDEAMHVAHSVISYWAPEIVITRGDSVNRQILLTIYDGGAGFPPHSWHIPGGYNLWPELDIQETVTRIASSELGRPVEYLERILGEHKWTTEEHPYGHPLSLYCLCKPIGQAEFPETERRRYFGRTELPATLLGPHRNFASRYLAMG